MHFPQRDVPDRLDVLVIGSFNVDLGLRIDWLPAPAR
jgi:hypothetical protein